MSCGYPHCMMGGGSCPYESRCNAEMDEENKQRDEKARLDLEEQRLRIKRLKLLTEGEPWDDLGMGI